MSHSWNGLDWIGRRSREDGSCDFEVDHGWIGAGFRNWIFRCVRDFTPGVTVILYRSMLVFRRLDLR